MGARRPSREDLEQRVRELERENAELRALVERLEARVTELERELARHSGNSSLPPSGDTLAQRAAQAEARKARRAKDARRQGKQPGARGAHLARVEHPDRTVRHAPQACGSCGEALDDAPITGEESRQVFDLPERRCEVTDHVAERRRCRCGHETAGAFPAGAAAPACWGPGVRAVAVYLLVRQHLPIRAHRRAVGRPCGCSGVDGMAGRAHRRGRHRTGAVPGGPAGSSRRLPRGPRR